MGQYDALLKPLKIKGLTLRNRVMSTSHAPSYVEDGRPKERYQLYHEEKAKGGIALTGFGGSTNIAPDSPSAFGQIYAGDDDVIPYFKELADRVHKHGAATMCQITHMGRRTRWDTADWMPIVAPSAVREPAHRAFPKEIEDTDIRRIVKAYAAAARRCQQGDLDGVEVLATGHLIDQFWSPNTNRRTDQYGGSLENRMRFSIEVLEAMRAAVGDDYVIGIRATVDEFLDSGLSHEEGIEIIERLATVGLIDFANINAGHIENHMGLARFIPNMAFPPAPYLHFASAVKARVDVPIFHATKIADVATAARAVEEGHIDMAALTRAHMADPHIARKVMEDRVDDIRQCVGAGYCIDRIYFAGMAHCIQNAATGREATMPHVVPRSETPGRKIVVVGAGPAGLEAARVSAERGHDVVLFEAADRIGGQINLAARATWRENLSGIPRWLGMQIDKLGVDLRLDTTATMADVEAEAPEIVIVATGGRPDLGDFKGSDLAVSSWDMLRGDVEPAENVLVFDDNGQHQGPACAEHMAKSGALVELVTPDRMVAEEMGSSNFPIHLRELYKLDVVLTPDQRLTEVFREGNKLIAVLRNEYTDAEEERAVDQVVVEHGALPEDGLYFDLKEASSNRGEVDMDALIAGAPQAIVNNPDGAFQLFRVGDAVASRNIHAAIYDSLRLCKDF